MLNTSSPGGITLRQRRFRMCCWDVQSNTRRPISVYRLGEMPIQSCGQSVSARRGKAGARLNAHTELQTQHQRSARGGKRYTEIGQLLVGRTGSIQSLAWTGAASRRGTPLPGGSFRTGRIYELKEPVRLTINLSRANTLAGGSFRTSTGPRSEHDLASGDCSYKHSTEIGA
jgi:hypothetical protein